VMRVREGELHSHLKFQFESYLRRTWLAGCFLIVIVMVLAQGCK
jgi:hypothetical protein